MTGVLCLLCTPVHLRAMTSLSGDSKVCDSPPGDGLSDSGMVSTLWKDSQVIHAASPSTRTTTASWTFYASNGVSIFMTPRSFSSLGDSDSYVVIGMPWVTVIMIMITHQFLSPFRGSFSFLLSPHIS